jgi:hypothetical protein
MHIRNPDWQGYHEKIRGYLFGLGVGVDVYRPERFEEADIFREVREDPKLETVKYLLNYYKIHSQSCLIEYQPKQQNVAI